MSDGGDGARREDEDDNNNKNEDDDEESDSSNASPDISKNVSFDFLNQDSLVDEADAIALLKQIFPEESTQALRELHHRHVYGTSSRPQSKLGRRVWQSLPLHEEWAPVDLPDEFLRLPTAVAVRRTLGETTRYEFIADLHQRALQEYLLVKHHEDATILESTFSTTTLLHSNQTFYYFTAVIHRHDQLGLGLTLVQTPQIQVHALVSHPDNPCLATEIQPGDILLGINGSTFFPSESSPMKQAVRALQSSPNPVVLHWIRRTQTPVQRDRSLLDSSWHEEDDDLKHHPHQHQNQHHNDTDTISIVTASTITTVASSSAPAIHPLAIALSKRGLIRGIKDQQRITQRLREFTARAHQWESFQSLRMDATTHQLLPREEPDLEMHPPSTPLDYTVESYPSRLRSYPAEPWNEVFVPLYNIRKALSCRIVHTFLDRDQTAYSIWVYDAETGKEWYAPIRYWHDFEDLSKACQHLSKTDWGFPKQRWFQKPQEPPPHLLEHFLRNLCSLVYTCQPLSTEIAELAIHVQSFLGVEAGLANDWEQYDSLRQELQRSLQRYTYRIFLLNVMKAIINDFVDATRARGPKLEEIESLQMQATLQDRARSDLERIQAFLDQLVDLILEGCEHDLHQIAQHTYYVDVVDDSWERLVREAVREQVEIEVYVPLRSVVSRLLVNGWRHEDMQVQFKIKELSKRPQELFRIRHCSTSNWQSVSTILKQGVGMSTLPCVKLRAIVDAAREINRLYQEEHHTNYPLGADDFLPIFIFCVVRADMERPCALCILLQTLCDKLNRMGEIGYFLASFEAAIAHITDLDLTHDKDDEELWIESLTDISLKD